MRLTRGSRNRSGLGSPRVVVVVVVDVFVVVVVFVFFAIA